MSETSYDTFVRDGAAGFSTGGVRDYVSLLKPRVMSLVVFSGFAGLVVAPGEIHPFLAAVAIFCIAIASGASGAINMWYDRDIDAVMTRTRGRPIPMGKVPAAEALSFGIVLAAFSVALMGIGAQLGRGGAAGRSGPVLCFCLHDLAEAPDASRTS